MVDALTHSVAVVLIVCLVFVENIPLFKHWWAGKLVYIVLALNAFFAREDPGLALLSALLFVMVLIINHRQRGPPPRE